MNEQDIPSDLITFDEAAALCGVATGTFRRWRRQGKLSENIVFYEGPPPEGGGLPVPMVSAAQVQAHLDRKGTRTGGRTHARTVRRTNERTDEQADGRTHERTNERADARTNERTGGRTDTHSGEGSSDANTPWPPEAQERVADLEDDVRALSIQLETMRETQQVYARTLTGQIRQLTDEGAKQSQQTYALQVRSSAEVHVAQREAALLEEQVEDLRKGQDALSEAQKLLAAQYEARISDLRSSHERELEAVRAGGVAQIDALRESLARAQAETDRQVAIGAARDRQLAQAQAELEAYRAWAAKGGLGRMFSRPEVPEAPRALLAGEEGE